MKKIFALALSLVLLCLAFAGCTRGEALFNFVPQDIKRLTVKYYDGTTPFEEIVEDKKIIEYVVSNYSSARFVETTEPFVEDGDSTLEVIFHKTDGTRVTVDQRSELRLVFGYQYTAISGRIDLLCLLCLCWNGSSDLELEEVLDALESCLEQGYISPYAEQFLADNGR